MPVTGYDYGFEEAKLGHVSVTVDRLSYGASPTPNATHRSPQRAQPMAFA